MRRCLWTALALMGLAPPAVAADLIGPYAGPQTGLYGGAPGVPELPPAPRYFPRGDGTDAGAPAPASPRRVVVACTPRRVPVPTNSPDDPSYVGSPYGLGRPSYYGFTPPPGIDDPYGRPLLPYCR